MKKIPVRSKYFIKQVVDYSTPNKDYFMYAGIFCHFWGLFEWIISDIIFNKKDTLLKDKSLNNLLSKVGIGEKINLGTKLKKCKSTEDVFYMDNNWVKTSDKLDLIATTRATIYKEINNAKDLRDTIAHNNILFYISTGAYQFMNGWIKKNYDKEETTLWKKSLEKAKVNNPQITTEEINTKIYLTYTLEDIKNCVKEVISVITNLNYGISSDNTFLILQKEDLL